MATEEGEPTIGLAAVGNLDSVMVDQEGMLVYMFDKDTQGSGESACTDGCAESWPPVTVESEDELSAAGGVSAELGVMERADGTLQVTANGWPLYYFAGDEEPGDANGVGVNDAWWPLSWNGERVVPQPPTVRVRSTDEHGDVLIGPNDRAIYQFDQDTQGSGETACPDIEGCEEAWPPLTVENGGQLEAGENVTAELTTLEREDGTLQVVVNGWPAYYFAGDEAAGDTNGQGVKDVWWLLDPAGKPLRTSATVQVASHDEHGDILVGPDEMTLYLFTQDTQGAGESACTDGCAESWPPLTVESAGQVTVGPDVGADVSTFERADGSVQVTANGWPLYHFAGDEAVGDATGQGVQDAWWVLDPAGEQIGGAGVEFASLEEAVTQTNEIIDTLNNGDQSISAINEPLNESIEPVATVDPVEASTSEEASSESERLLNEVDRVSVNAITQAVAQINDEAGFEWVPADTDTPEEAREQADSKEGTSQAAADFLRLGANVSEYATEELEPAAIGLGNV